MKAMIFAAGRGERLRPLTDTTPKPLLEVGGRALIEHHLLRLAAAGMREVVINTAWLAEQFPQCLGDGSRYGLSILYSFEGQRALETGGGLLNALPLLGAEPFLLVNGDIYTDMDFVPFLEALQGSRHSRLRGNDGTVSTIAPPMLAHLAMVAPPAGKPGDFALAADGRLHAEPDPRFGTPLTYSGVAAIHPQLFDGWREAFAPEDIAGHPPSFRLAPLLRHAMRRGAVRGQLHEGDWTDAGTPQMLEGLRSRQG